MRELRLFLYFLLGFFLSAYTVVSNAETYTPIPGYLANNRCITSAATACTIRLQAFAGQILKSADPTATGAKCISTHPAQPGQEYNLVNVAACKTCDVSTGIEWGGATCKKTCTPPEILDVTTGECKPPVQPCEAGELNTHFMESATVSTANRFCAADGCVENYIKATPVGYSCSYGASGFGFCRQGYSLTTSRTGQRCDYENNEFPPPPDDPQPDPDKTCPDGHGMATAGNGFIRCLPNGTNEPEEREREHYDPQNPDVPPNRTNEGGDGDTETTVCENGICKKQTSHVNPDGSVDVETITSPQDIFCEKNPYNAACKSAGGGSGGDGGDEGDGECDPTIGMCGSPGTGGLYEKKDKTFAGVLKSFSDGFRATGLGGAITGYFNVSISAGSCPSWSVHVPYFNKALSLGDYFCTSAGQTMMQIAGAVLMVCAAFTGFKWAVL